MCAGQFSNAVICDHINDRAVCCAAFPLSEDHKPNRTDERQRIESAGGVVVWAGTWRVGGVLAVSRAFGMSVTALGHCCIIHVVHL